MSEKQISQAVAGKNSQTLRRQLQESESENIRRRRKIIGLSLVGIAALTLPEAEQAWKSLTKD